VNTDRLLAFALDCAEVLDAAGIPDSGRILVIPQACQSSPPLGHADRFTVCTVAGEMLVHEDCAIFGRGDRIFSKRIPT
jgi:hypothetical protein